MFADDAAGFAEDDFDEAGILAAVDVGCGGKVDGALGCSDCCQVDQAIFGFGDDLLSEDENVVLVEGEFGFFRGGEEDAWEIVAGADFGNVEDGEELDWAGIGHEAWSSATERFTTESAENTERGREERGTAVGRAP